jgi:hypothetical protein
MKTPFLIALLVVLAASCLGPQDSPSTLKDLRILGISFEPSELLFPCDAKLLQALATAGTPTGSIALDPATQARLFAFAARPLQFRALIGDPLNRPLTYRLAACAKRGDRECDDEGQFAELDRGTFEAGELKATVAPGAKILDDGTPLLIETVTNDSVRGLGGIRMPIVLDMRAPKTSERIVGQKLMVYSCQFFREQKPNVTPVLPGLKFSSESWAESEVKESSGQTEIAIEPVDFSDREETYVVPSFQLTPITLTESWKISWIASSGSFSPENTGGTDFAGQASKIKTKWKPDPDATGPQEVTVWAVVRDGRGGQSWLVRKFRWKP